ncbi:hypothetical protein BDF22DRAFT_739350 [Syncephalis plumigaleata]|nr:hypothetical protein BDF22DRAFT_739350 [Syncephalis plumigaleata]
MRLTSTLLSGRDNDQYFMLDPSSPTNDTFNTEVGVLDGQDKKRWSLINTNTNTKSKAREPERNKKRTSWLSIPMRRNLFGSFGVPNYLADTCIEAGPYILDLSTNWQDISPAISSNGFARAVRTLSRVPNMTADRSMNSNDNMNGSSHMNGTPPSVADLWSGSIIDEMVVNSTAENELQAPYKSGESRSSMNPPVVLPAEVAIAQLTEHIALRLYTLWTCSTEDPSNNAGRAVGRTLSPLVLDNLRQSVELVLNRGGLSLKHTASLSPFVQQLASPPDSAASDSFSFASSIASSSSSLPQPSSNYLQPQSQNPFLTSLPSTSSISTSSSPIIRPAIPVKLAAHEAEYAVRASLQQVFGEHISSARKSQLMERARLTLERCLASERRLSSNERQSMYRFQRLQSPIAWETVQWRFVVEK